MRRHYTASLMLALLIVGVATAWVALAPVQVGGPLAYIIVNGNSMEPVFYRGDLVITRWASHYEPGDIAAYRHPQVGLIIHRIVGERGGRFVLKGDHNTWLDSYQPGPMEIVGKLWLHAPGLGKTLEAVRSPGVLAALTILLAGAVMLTTTSPNVPTRPARRGGRRLRLEKEMMRRVNEHQETFFLVLAVIAFAALLLGAAAFTRPLTQTAIEGVPYEHRGAFSYTAAAPQNVYDNNTIKSGDPIFRRLANRVEVSFEYELLAETVSEVKGTYRLVAEVGDSVNNWKRTLELSPETPFAGNSFTATVVLDIDQMLSLVENLSEKTGVSRQQYTLTVIPEVSVQGLAEGTAIEAQFAPRLKFQVDDLEIYLASSSPLDSEDPLEPALGGVYQKTTTEANTIPIFGWGLNVTLARVMAVAGLVVAAGMGGVVYLQMRAGYNKGEGAAIELKYGPMIISLAGDDPTAGRRAVKVKGIDDLAKLAEREGRMILHSARDGGHQYYVQDAEVVYQYQAAGTEGLPLILPEHERLVEGWASILESRKIESRESLTRLVNLTLHLARKMGAPESQMMFVRWGVLLHDIGKIALPDSVLLKPGPLDGDEWQSIRYAPSRAHDVLAGTPMQMALDIPYCRGERWDGGGYPRGLKGEAIPLAARVFSVVEVWEAMQAERPHRAAFSAEEARQYLLEQSGKHFDPQVVQAFLEMEGLWGLAGNITPG